MNGSCRLNSVNSYLWFVSNLSLNPRTKPHDAAQDLVASSLTVAESAPVLPQPGLGLRIA